MAFKRASEMGSWSDGSNISPDPEYKELTGRLPSAGILYPKGHRIMVRPFWYEEVYRVSDQIEKAMAGVGSSDFYEHVLAGVSVFTPDGSEFKPTDITLGDFLYILLYRKVISLGTDKFQVKVQGEEDPVTIKLDQLEFYDLKEKLAEVQESSLFDDDLNFPISIEMPKLKLRFSPVTIGDWIEFYRTLDGTPTMWDQAYINLIPEDRTEENRTLIRKGSGEFLDGIRSVQGMMNHGIKAIEYVTKGGEVRTLDIEDPTHIVLPFRSDERSSQVKVRFS